MFNNFVQNFVQGINFDGTHLQLWGFMLCQFLKVRWTLLKVPVSNFQRVILFLLLPKDYRNSVYPACKFFFFFLMLKCISFLRLL